jgi:hypothetical protein
MKAKALAVTGICALALAACGGSSTTTLHGSFTDDQDVSGTLPCAQQESSSAITVAVDNVPAGNATINWQGNPRDLGTSLAGNTVMGCSGTWQITVPTAHISYILGISGLGGVSGTVTIPISQSGQNITLDDNEPTENGGALEVSQ